MLGLALLLTAAGFLQVPLDLTLGLSGRSETLRFPKYLFNPDSASLPFALSFALAFGEATAFAFGEAAVAANRFGAMVLNSKLNSTLAFKIPFNLNVLSVLQLANAVKAQPLATIQNETSTCGNLNCVPTGGNNVETTMHISNVTSWMWIALLSPRTFACLNPAMVASKLLTWLASQNLLYHLAF